MSDRIHSLTVIFENDVHEDPAKEIAQVLRYMRGVIEVRMNVADFTESHIAERRVKNELANKLLDIVSGLQK